MGTFLHGWESPEVNVWPIFHVDISTCNSFPEMLENHALSQLNNNNLILQMDGARVHFTHVIYPWLFECECPMFTRANFVAPPYSFRLSSLGPCEREGAEPASEHTRWTQSMDHCNSCKCYKGYVMVCLVKRWTIPRVYAHLKMTFTMKHFAPNNFSTCM